MGANHQYKDSVFTLLFNDRDKLRELYEAIAGIRLDDDVEITINTLEGVLFSSIKNDVSLIITIPRPEFIVFYNGSEPYDEEKTLKLSALFEKAEDLGIEPRSLSDL